jgi:hypothetical protein
VSNGNVEEALETETAITEPLRVSNQINVPKGGGGSDDDEIEWEDGGKASDLKGPKIKKRDVIMSDSESEDEDSAQQSAIDMEPSSKKPKLLSKSIFEDSSDDDEETKSTTEKDLSSANVASGVSSDAPVRNVVLHALSDDSCDRDAIVLTTDGAVSISVDETSKDLILESKAKDDSVLLDGAATVPRARVSVG